jgi:DNA-binding LytR/AlgR family response regulator
MVCCAWRGMQMNIAICDDTSADAKLIKDCILDYYQTRITIDVFNNEIDFLEKFKRNYYDIIFMDIYLAKGDGIAVSKTIRQTDGNCLIVFITTSSDHAIEAFQVDAAHYLKKPISGGEMALVLQKCDKILSKKSRFIPVKSERSVKKVYLSELMYIEVHHNTCRIVMKDGDIKTRQTMSELERLVTDSGGGKGFIRCHQSYLINMDYIKEVKNNCFIMENGDIATIRRYDRPAIKAAFEDYIFSKMK